MSSQNPLSYLNNEPSKQPDFIIADRSPSSNDIQPAGTRWQHRNGTTNVIYQTEGNGEWVASNPQTSRVLLTSQEVKALTTSPIELVASPGENKVIQFMGALLKLNYGGTNAFTEVDDNLVVNYTDGSGVSVSNTIEMTGFIDQTADTYTNAIAVQDVIVAASGSENQALVLFNPNDDIAGNAANDNTLLVVVSYMVIDG